MSKKIVRPTSAASALDDREIEERRHRLLRAVLLGGALSICAMFSLYGFQVAVRQQNLSFITIFAWSSFALIVSAALSFGTGIYSFFTERAPREHRQSYPIAADSEYIASYSLTDRIISLVPCFFFIWLTIFFWRAEGHDGMKLFLISFSFASAYATVQYFYTSLRFTASGLIFRSLWTGPVCAQYADVESISGRLNGVSVHLRDGRRIQIHPGLGEADVVIEYLRQRCREATVSQ